MHTEHLRNVHVTWVVIGWVAAVGVTAAVIVAAAGLGFLDTSRASTGWEIFAVAIGFWTGGYLTGTRDIDAPILHGIGIGLMSLVAWFVLSLLTEIFLARGEWSALTPAVTAALLLEQMVAAVAGAWLADRRAVRGKEVG